MIPGRAISPPSKFLNTSISLGGKRVESNLKVYQKCSPKGLMFPRTNLTSKKKIQNTPNEIKKELLEKKILLSKRYQTKNPIVQRKSLNPSMSTNMLSPVQRSLGNLKSKKVFSKKNSLKPISKKSMNLADQKSSSHHIKSKNPVQNKKNIKKATIKKCVVRNPRYEILSKRNNIHAHKPKRKKITTYNKQKNTDFENSICLLGNDKTKSTQEIKKIRQVTELDKSSNLINTETHKKLNVDALNKYPTKPINEVKCPNSEISRPRETSKRTLKTLTSPKTPIQNPKITQNPQKNPQKPQTVEITLLL